MHLIFFHGKNEIEKSEKNSKKRDSRREKRDLDFSLSLLITHGKFHGWKALHLEDINENVPVMATIIKLTQ